MISELHKVSNETPAFQKKQYEFAAHIRNPEKHARPNEVEDRRMAIYRDLFYNNVEGFISNTFPVLRSLIDDENWHTIVRDFFSKHHCKTPLFLEIPEEFLNYLQEEREPSNEDLAFLLELAHYEWVELALSVDEEEIPTEGINPDGDMIEGIPVLSPVAWPLQYQFDVHHIDEDYQPDIPPEQPTNLVVYRDREDEIGFMEINPVTARLLTLMEELPGKSGSEYLQIIANELNHPDPAVVINGGRELMEQLREADILIGTRIQ